MLSERQSDTNRIRRIAGSFKGKRASTPSSIPPPNMAPMDGADHAPTTPSARSVPAASESITVPKQLGSASGQGLETLPTVNEHAVLIVVANYWSFSTCLWPRVAISTESEQILSVQNPGSDFLANAQNVLITGDTFSNILPANTKESQMSIPVPQKPNSTSLFVGRKDALDKFRKISIHSADTKPPHYVGSLRPYPLLESAVVDWDLIEHPSTMTLNKYLRLGLNRLLVEQATTLPLPAISIISIYLPWTINVRARNGAYVTPEDIFDAVYLSLRTNITANEFNSLPHLEDQKRAARAYRQRYSRFLGICAYNEEKRGGMKRIDFLMGRTTFHSISNTGRRSDEWWLNVS